MSIDATTAATKMRKMREGALARPHRFLGEERDVHREDWDLFLVVVDRDSLPFCSYDS